MIIDWTGFFNQSIAEKFINSDNYDFSLMLIDMSETFNTVNAYDSLWKSLD